MKLLGALLGCVGAFAYSKKDATEQEQKVAKTGTQLTAEPPASAK